MPIKVISGILMFLFGTAAGIFTALSAFGVLGDMEDLELPLAKATSIAVDRKGRIYCAGAMYERIQVYSGDGAFLRGWRVETTGTFRIRAADRPGGGVVAALADDPVYTYSPEGNLLSSSEDPGAFSRLGKNDLMEGSDDGGNRYRLILRWIYPSIIKTPPSGEKELIYFTPPHLWLIRMPLPALLIQVGGILLVAFDRRARAFFRKWMDRVKKVPPGD